MNDAPFLAGHSTKMCYELLKDNMDKLEENYYISGYADSRFITHDLTESQIEERYSKITSIYDNLDPYKMNRYCCVERCTIFGGSFNFNLGLICRLTLLMVSSSCSKPFAGRYAA